MALDARLVGFAAALRSHGVAAGPGEVVDAAAVVAALGLTERERLRTGLAAALLRRAGQREVFDALFDVWFPAALGDPTALDGALAAAMTPQDRRERAAALRATLAEALALGDARALAELAARVVAELGRLANEASAGAFSSAQALDALAPRTAIATAESMLDGEAGGGAGPGRGGGFSRRFTRDELRDAVTAFTRAVETETRRRNAEARGVERISRYAVRPPAELAPFLLAGTRDLDELRRTVTPLARKLATRLAARRRRARRGTIDVRRTLRASMATGGVPVRPAWAHRQRARTDIVVLADLSSSVAGFSRFTILLLQALAASFRRIRVFGFVNVVDELTETIVRAPLGTDLSAAFDDTSRMVRYHRNSDYGSALLDFTTTYLDAVGPRTVVLILGDARTNGTDPRVLELHRIAERARHVAWLNPEAATQWNSGDSVASIYGQVVDMHECRNAAQLRDFVARVLPV